MKKQIDKLTEILDHIIDDYGLTYDYVIEELEETIHFAVEVFNKEIGKEHGSKCMRVKVDEKCNVFIEIGEDIWEPLDYYTRDEMNFWKAFLEWPF